MSRSSILETVARAAFPAVLVFSLYLLFVGHNAPGGGFVGGLVAGAGLVLRFLAAGSVGLRTITRVRYEVLLGFGLGLAALAGAAGWVLGGAFLESSYVEGRLPLYGEVALVSPLFFDIGVYCVVVGLVLGVLSTLGDAPGDPVAGPPRPETDARQRPSR